MACTTTNLTLSIDLRICFHDLKPRFLCHTTPQVLKIKKKNKNGTFRHITCHQGTEEHFGTSREWVVNATPQPLYPRERDHLPTLQEAGWTSGPGWTRKENVSHTGFLIPDRPGRREPLYRLHYAAAQHVG